ncbi:hypothetical protein PsYK624_102290 [Phanerochaete sordida]|uniref:YDG domain-containing protein n=1 Tax=Phanerochaete sordida TaxID=48140 RepID=A0A9P3LG02_9APHY|nr:hypothetical protein PsYK624_102290 [Phanerochaete sordida]
MSSRRTGKGPVSFVFGEIPGVQVGRRFESRDALRDAGVHGMNEAGIHGRKRVGAVSVVLSDGFDNEDHGEHFVYIGSGGRKSDQHLGDQVSDQSFNVSANEALRKSAEDHKPVRVIRCFRLRSRYAPAEGFRYDGLYVVTNPRVEVVPDGPNVCKFDFQRLPGQDPLPADVPGYHYMTDIEIRRRMFLEARAQQAALADAGTALQAGPSVTERDVAQERGSGQQGEGDGVAPGDIEAIETALEPILPHLEKIQAPETSEDSRTEALASVGEHISAVLEKKESTISAGGDGGDTGSKDDGASTGAHSTAHSAQWWYEALYAYVWCALPRLAAERVPVPSEAKEACSEAAKHMQRKSEERKRRREAGEESTSGSDESPPRKKPRRAVKKEGKA